MPNIIMADEKGNPVYCNPAGVVYAKKMNLTKIRESIISNMYSSCPHMEEIYCEHTGKIGGGSSVKSVVGYFRYCIGLKTAKFPYCSGVASSYVEYFLGDCTALRTVQFGSVGYPITELANTSYNQKIFSNTTQQTLTITVYVDAETLADVPAEVKTYQPWGATGATVIYRSSNTGEVITA